MKNNVLMILVCLHNAAIGQNHLGFETYSYSNATATPVSKVYFQDRHNWYGEVRYNYEASQSLSLYAGRTFSVQSKQSDISYSVTPLAGVVAGRFRGVSAGLNASADIKKFSFSSTLQYTRSTNDNRQSFFYSWSELGYQLSDFLYAGLALQQTGLCQTGTSLEPGVQLCASLGTWKVPLYLFKRIGDKTYFVIGLNKDFDKL